MERREFSFLPLSPEIQQILVEKNFTHATPIQSEAIPVLLSADLVHFHGQAQTGTGKTLAFGLPMLEKIDAKSNAAQALVVAPTRELAAQIYESLLPFAEAKGLRMNLVYGGTSFERQVRGFKGAQIIIGTSGRIIDHLQRKTCSLGDIRTVVLDEADRMLDMGFWEEVQTIIQYCTAPKEIWLFSATLKDGIRQLKRDHMPDAQIVRVEPEKTAQETVEQLYCVVPHHSKCAALCRFIDSADNFYGFIFCQTKILTSEVADKLTAFGYRAAALHGDLSQPQRDAIIKKFRDQELKIVVATDVAARGIDVDNLTHVINFSVPEDHESYIHRIGRTGRAGRSGTAITLVQPGDIRSLKHLQKKFKLNLQETEVPAYEALVDKAIVRAGEFLVDLQQKSVSKIPQALKDFVESQEAEELPGLIQLLLYERFIVPLKRHEMKASAPRTPRRSGEYEDRRDDRRGDRGGSYRSAGGFRDRERGDREPRRRVADFATQEVMLSVGKLDGLEQDTIHDMITQATSITRSQIAKVRVLDKRTYIHVADECVNRVLSGLKNKRFNGRMGRPQLVRNTQQPYA